MLDARNAFVLETDIISEYCFNFYDKYYHLANEMLNFRIFTSWKKVKNS